MSHRATTVDGHARTRKTVLGVALLALVAATVGLAPAAIAGTTHTRADRHARARALQAHARAAVRPAVPADRTAAKSARVVAPRTAGVVKGPVLLLSQYSKSGSTVGKLDLATGKVTTLVTGSMPCVTVPRLSPDGSKIVAVTYSNVDCFTGTTTIATFDASTGAQLQTLDTITADASDYFEAPGWSPDGTKILYTRWTPSTAQLFTVPAAGGTSATPLGQAGMLDGVYSPDGTKIVAADYNLDQLDVLNVAGGVLTTIPVLSYPAAPAWSPDGTRISFSYDKQESGGDNNGLAVMQADGTGLIQRLASTTAASNTNVFSSSWSDDGTQIFYDAVGVVPGSNPTVYTAPPAIYVTDTVGGVYPATVRTITPTTVFGDPFFVLSSPPAVPAGSTYTAITPVRVQSQTPVTAGGTIDVQIAGANGIPSGASAVTLNLTGVAPTASTWLTAYPKPADTSYPVVSNLNLVAKQTAAIAVQVTLSTDGYVRIRNQAGTTGVIVDVSGYFMPGTSDAGYTPLAKPYRALDAKIGPAASSTVDLTTVPGAPSGATAVVLNLTADQPNIGTWLSVVPTAAPFTKPSVSNLNLPKGTTRANLVTATIGDGNSITVYNAAGSVRTIVDVVGFYTTGSGQSYYPLAPLRILDTRDGTRTYLGTVTPLTQARPSLDLPTYGTIVTATGITAVPTWATAVAANLTGVFPTVGTFLSVVASPGTTNTSSVNLPKGGVVPNLVISSVGSFATTQGAIRVTNSAGAIDVIADLAGYYGPAQLA